MKHDECLKVALPRGFSNIPLTKVYANLNYKSAVVFVSVPWSKWCWTGTLMAMQAALCQDHGLTAQTGLSFTSVTLHPIICLIADMKQLTVCRGYHGEEGRGTQWARL